MGFDFANRSVLLLLVVLLPLLFWRLLRRPSHPAIVFPTVSHFKGLRPTLRQRLAVLAPLLQIAAVSLIVIAAARPQKGDARTVIRRRGVAIQMVLDRSGSMEQEMNYGGRLRPRIEIVKEVFGDFVAGKGELPGRQTDLIGLTTFARFAEENCPLVSMHEPLLASVKNLTTVPPFLTRYRQPTREREEAKFVNPLNRTAIGDALQRAVYSLITAEEDLQRVEPGSRYEIKGKVAIVLTDGENNAGVDPEEAAASARANGIKVYFIVMRDLVEYEETFFGLRAKREISREEVMALPERIAGMTGGKAYLALDGDALRGTYGDIDRLERTEIGKIEYRSYHERYSLFLLPAIALLVLGSLLGDTFLRRVP